MSRSSRLFRRSAWDAAPVALAAGLGALLALVPTAPVVALVVWWGSNTASHVFLHAPFFRRRPLNFAFSTYLTLLLGVPQSLWRALHLAHHAGSRPRGLISARIALETALVLGLWSAMAAAAPRWLLVSYAPGYFAGLALCWIHGRGEHARGTTSCRGRLYNLVFFNDGFHAEHHAAPGLHWTLLPSRRIEGARTSRWPPVLRWLEVFGLEGLERIVLRSPALQRIVLAAHERALRSVLRDAGPLRSAAVVGGGLFPRTALALRRIVPRARITVIDRSAESIALSRRLAPEGVRFVREGFDPARHSGFDLVVIPLSFVGDREALYRRPPAPRLVVHDWIWRPRGRSVVVSVLLLKRLNLIAGGRRIVPRREREEDPCRPARKKGARSSCAASFSGTSPPP